MFGGSIKDQITGAPVLEPIDDSWLDTFFDFEAASASPEVLGGTHPPNEYEWAGPPRLAGA